MSASSSNPTYVIDFDSTIITAESLEELAAIALRDRKDRRVTLANLQEITRQGMAGTLRFDQSLQRRLRLFSPTQAHIEELTIKLQLMITPSFWQHRSWLAAHAADIYVISGGFEEVIIPVVARLGLYPDHVLANAFVCDPQGRIIGYDITRLLSQPAGKVKQVAMLKLPGPVVVLGDGYTDYEIRAHGEADVFWAFTENVSRPEVTKRADRIVRSLSDIVV